MAQSGLYVATKREFVKERNNKKKKPEQLADSESAGALSMVMGKKNQKLAQFYLRSNCLK